VSAAATAYVGLGSNLEEPRRQILGAFEALAAIPRTRVAQRSRLYRTPPWGKLDQPAFVNAVAKLETRLAPRDLLDALQAIERGAGRERTERWGPRVLDLDLLLHGEVVVDVPGLRLPHPNLHERAFVLVPLAEIAPQLRLPPIGPCVADLLAAVDRSGIEALG
jgi:2-amino-4-hydroxy-6-hydroxymethyldihydropteridine diphosphokinase